MTQEEFEAKRKLMCDTITGCAFRTFNYWHAGVDELVYEAGLCCELEDADYFVHRQEEYPIYYKGRPSKVKRRFDLIVTDRELGNVIIELKAMDTVGDQQRKQLWSYLRLTNSPFGMLINFSPNGVYTERWGYDSDTQKCYRIRDKNQEQ